MLQVLSQQSNVTYFMRLRAKAVCNFQTSYRPRTAVIYGRCGGGTVGNFGKAGAMLGQSNGRALLFEGDAGLVEVS